MNKFDTYVKQILEADMATSQSSGSSGSSGTATCGDIVRLVVKIFRDTNADTKVADAIENDILKNPNNQTILNTSPDTPQREIALKILLNNVTSKFGSGNPSDIAKIQKLGGDEPLKSGYFNKTTGLGVERGDYIKHGATEQAFRNAMFDFKQGNVFKKIGLLGKLGKNLLGATSSGSTGVFA